MTSPAPKKPSRLISIDEVLADAPVNRRTIERLMDEGVLQRVKVRRRTFVVRESWDNFIKKGGSRR